MDPVELKEKLQQQHCVRLRQYLCPLRRPDKADVILSCDGTLFVAHKIILRSSGDFFCRKMKNAALDGTVRIQETDPDTLTAILNFLYLDVQKLTTFDQLSRLTSAARIMELVDLFEYCCDSLLLVLSNENAFAILDIYQQYEQERHWTKVLQYMVVNFERLSGTKNASVSQLKELLKIAVANSWCLDKLFVGVALWLKCDLKRLKKYAGELLNCIDARLVTTNCVTAMLKRKRLLAVSPEMSQLVREIAVKVFVFNEYARLKQPIYDDSSLLCENRLIVFFADHCLDEFFLPETMCMITHNQPSKSAQVFDVGRMTWHSVKTISFKATDIKVMPLWQNGTQIEMILGRENENCVHYNLETSYIREARKCVKLDAIMDTKVCSFKDHVYLVGGIDTESAAPMSRVLYCKNDDKLDNWEEGKPLKSAVCDSVLLVTSDYIYVISSINKYVIVQFNMGVAKGLNWDIFYLARPSHCCVDEKNFFVYQNTLCGLYVEKSETVFLTFDPIKKEIAERRFPSCPVGRLDVQRVCLFPETRYTNVVYVSTVWERIIPDHMWCPENGKWTKLGVVKGQNKVCVDDDYDDWSVKWIFITSSFF